MKNLANPYEVPEKLNLWTRKPVRPGKKNPASTVADVMAGQNFPFPSVGNGYPYPPIIINTARDDIKTTPTRHPTRSNARVTSDSPGSPLSPRNGRGRKRPSPSLVDIDDPLLEDWLPALDNDRIRGRDRQNYARWVATMNEAGLIRLQDLEEISATDMRTLFSMNVGTALRISRFVHEDLVKLREEARKRSRLDA